MSRELVVVVVVGRMKAEARHALHVYFAHCDGGLSTSLFFCLFPVMFKYNITCFFLVVPSPIVSLFLGGLSPVRIVVSWSDFTTKEARQRTVHAV